MVAAVFDSDNKSDKCVRSEAKNCHPVPQKYCTGQSVPLFGKNTNARSDTRGLLSCNEAQTRQKLRYNL